MGVQADIPQRDTSSPSRSGKLEGAGHALATLGGVIGTIATVIGTLLALGVIHPFGSGGPSVAQAAVTTIDEGTSSAGCAESVTGPRPSQSYEFVSSGTYDFRLNRAQLTYDFTQLAMSHPRQFPRFLDVIRDRDTLYVKRPRPVGGKLWVELDESLLFPSTEAGKLFAYTTSPTGLLRSIRTTGEVKRLGKELLPDGTSATRYSGVIDLRKVADQAPPEVRASLQSGVDGLITDGWQSRWPAEAWLDDNGLIRQTELAFDVRGSTMWAQCQLWHFGITFNATAPPLNQVQIVRTARQLDTALGRP